MSVCLIGRDEAQWLPECLQSILPVADEIIYVDTGSKDHSKTIAAKFGARVFDYKWHDDFAAARNFSLQQAQGRWILVLDPDEIIAAADLDKLTEIIQQPHDPKQPLSYRIVTRNYTNRNDLVGSRSNDGSYPEAEKGCAWLPSVKARLWQNHPQIRFSYPVHELVEPALERLGAESQACEVVVHHYGKLDIEKDREKGRKYLAIGLRKIEEFSDSPAPLRELAIQAGMLEENEAAIKLWRRFLQANQENAEAWLNLGTALFKGNQLPEALKAVENAGKLQPLMKEPYFNRSLYDLHQGQAKKAAHRLEQLLLQLPDYQPARFLLAAAICLRDGIKAGRKAFAKIIDNQINQEMVAIAGEELAESLRRYQRNKDAATIKKATSKK